MKKKEMMFYKMCEAIDEDSIGTKPLTLLFDYISCNNEIEIVFRLSDHYVLVFKEMEVIKQIKKRRLILTNSEI